MCVCAYKNNWQCSFTHKQFLIKRSFFASCFPCGHHRCGVSSPRKSGRGLSEALSLMLPSTHTWDGFAGFIRLARGCYLMLHIADTGLGTWLGGGGGGVVSSEFQTLSDILWKVVFTQKVNFFFGSHVVCLQGQGLSALTRALVSESLAWFINLGCTARPRPGQRLAAGSPRASHRVHGLHFTWKSKLLPGPATRKLLCAVCGAHQL